MKSSTVNISFTDDLLKKIDRVARQGKIIGSGHRGGAIQVPCRTREELGRAGRTRHECVEEAHADHIVTGDAHLLDLREFRSIRLIRPQEFAVILG